jgi:hypothetical protein
MNIIRPDEVKDKERDEKAFTFLNVCSKSGNDILLKSLLVVENGQPYLSSFVFTYGFIAAIKNNQTNYVEPLLNYLVNNNISSDNQYSYLDIVFNATIEFGDFRLIEKLDKQFHIIQENLKAKANLEITINDTVYAEIRANGKIHLHSAFIPHQSMTEKIISKYALSPLRFNAKNFNRNILDYIFKQNYDINPMQIEKVFLESIINQNSEASLYFILNDKTRQIIKKSSIINAFLNDTETLLNAKKEVLSTLEMLELKEELQINHVKENKLKI